MKRSVWLSHNQCGILDSPKDKASSYFRTKERCVVDDRCFFLFFSYCYSFIHKKTKEAANL